VFDPRWSYLLAAVWLLAALYRVGELLLQGHVARALWKSAIPVPGEALAGLDVPLTVGKRRVKLCTSSEVDRPSVIGFLSPRILVPEWLFHQLTATELSHIVMHEMEHLRRRDDWVNLAQKIGLVLLPLNPALFWIDRRLSTERELACDDGVLERMKTPRAYAASLTSIAERRLESRPGKGIGALALAATGLRRRRSELGQRIERILERRSPVNPVLAGGFAAVLIFGILGSAALLVRAPQLVSFGAGAALPQTVASDAASGRRDLNARSASAIAGRQALPAAEFRNVSFRQPAESSSKRIGFVTHTRTKARAIPQDPAQMTAAPAPLQRQFVVLTSWEGSPVSRVVIATPDGRFFVAPYAAVPTQAGWLLVQL